MIADLTLRWVVTLLFVATAVEAVVSLGVSRHHRAAVVGHGFHLLMAVAMAVMAWPRGATLPTTAPMVVFLCATVWFVAVAAVVAVTSAERVVNGYYAVVMFAMAWMYAVMNGATLPGHDVGGADAGSAGGHSGHAGHAGHGGGQQVVASPDPSAAPTVPDYIPVMNWVWIVVFAAATLYWLNRYFFARPGGTNRPALQRFSLLSQAAMAAGMSVMYAVML